MLQDRIDPLVSREGGRNLPIAGLVSDGAGVAGTVQRLCTLAVDGLQRMALADQRFPYTFRSIGNRDGTGMRAEGDSLRYCAIVAQGLAWIPLDVQRRVLHGRTAAELACSSAERAAKTPEAGAVALAAWAAAEVAGEFRPGLFAILEELLKPGRAIETVTCAWALTAALAARHFGSTERVQEEASRRLMHSQASSGLFPHLTPTKGQGSWRSHIGCFADQVYPIQALARLGRARADNSALQAAQACADRIVALQGAAGQWWWHYDVRDGSVVEEYPVYSVHQHAMAPMALLDLLAAGGADHRDAIARGLQWIEMRPETQDGLISPQDGMIWRKVGRREPAKLVRSMAALTTTLRSGWRPSTIRRLCPAGVVDRECRPYELGWMLYAWCSHGLVDSQGF